MDSPRSASLLSLAADLERRDAAAAAEIEAIASLAGRAEAASRRAGKLSDFLQGVPSELAAIERAEAEQRDRLRQADEAIVAAEGLVAALAQDRRVSDEEREHVRRELVHARELAADAVARAERLRGRRADLRSAEAAGRAEAGELASEAEGIALALSTIPRVSESGRSRPEPTLAGLVAWGAQVRAAALVARSQLDIERDRLVREANELGSVVLGEQLSGQSVALVGRRVRVVLEG